MKFIDFSIQVVNSKKSGLPHYALVIDKGEDDSLWVGFHLRVDIWKNSEVNRIAKRLNALQLSIDLVDAELVILIRQAIQDEIQYQCDRYNERHA